MPVASLGETDLQVGARTIGRVRLLGFHPDQAIYPRLILTLGVSMQDLSPRDASAAPRLADVVGEISGPAKFELADVTGELRWSEHGPAVGELTWSGQRGHVTSYEYPSEHQIRLCCDLDPWRVERLQRLRGTSSPRFGLHLWPQVRANGTPVDASIRPFEVEVPLEQWAAFLKGVGQGESEFIEARFDGKVSESFRQAVQHTRSAREQLGNGRYEDAILSCRKAMDALGEQLAPKGGEGVEALMKERVPELHEHYYGIYSRLKKLASPVAHHYGSAWVFSRDQALFLVRCVEALIAFTGALTLQGPQEQ